MSCTPISQLLVPSLETKYLQHAAKPQQLS